MRTDTTQFELIDVPDLQEGMAWHWVSSVGDLVFTSGAIPHDANGDMGDDLSAPTQAERSFKNLERALVAAGSSMDRIVKITGYLTAPSILADVRVVRDRWIPHRPPSTFVYVAGLVDPRMVIELDAIAVKVP